MAVTAAGATVAAATISPQRAARADSDVTCSPVKLISVPGTWEITPSADPNAATGMLKGITDGLQQQFGSRVSTYTVPYDAQAFTQNETYADSEQAGLRAARAAVTKISQSCPGTKFVGIGYSQGADIVGDLLAQVGNGNGPVPAGDFIAGGNLADPQKGTDGEVVLGNELPGTQGLLGPRKGGYGALNGKMAEVCLKGDLYCASPKDNHLTLALGAVLGNVGLTNLLNSADDDLTQSPDPSKTDDPDKKEDGANPDLSLLPTGIKKLATQAKHKDAKGARRTATNLTALVQPVQALAKLASNPLLVNALLANPQTHDAGQVLQTLGQIDMAGLASDLDKATTAASNQDLDSLASVAADATGKIAPLAGVPTGQVAQVTTILLALQPTHLLGQANNILKLTKIDFAGITKAARALPEQMKKGDVKGTFRSVNAIEERLMPLAQIANDIDFRAIGAALELVPDQNAQLVGKALIVLDRVNWTRIVRDLRKMQTALEKFDPRHPPVIDQKHPVKSLDNVFGVNVLGMLPQVLDLGEHGLQVAGLKLPNGTLKQLVKEDLTPKNVVSEGLQVAVFYGSQVHVAYGTRSVDGTGKPAVDTLEEWLGQRIAAS
ncbi:cutinase family protein [Actinoallomurus sp. NBC_01490]|uniref:cutinase family protein n=1 Tax=Actinoallomurus sp. NBC_01490 TaxID=2903557 RepID=UPI002E37F456|nr:cutinase family protein [Actinoallomurus sp. NBC_01490]